MNHRRVEILLVEASVADAGTGTPRRRAIANEIPGVRRLLPVPCLLQRMPPYGIELGNTQIDRGSESPYPWPGLAARPNLLRAGDT